MNNQLVATDSVTSAASNVFAATALHVQEALTFELGDEEYGISLLCVQEIRSFQVPTRLAGADAQVLGFIDLRGEVVPLIDLRRRFGLPAVEANDVTVIIVISLGDRRVGVVADQVNDVVALTPAQIHRMPAMQGGAGQRHLVALASLEPQRTLVLLDIEALLRSADLGQVTEAVH